MEFKNPYWTTTEKLDMLAKWLIIHSIIYYTYDQNIVSDHMFDNNGLQFLKLRASASKDEIKAMRYGYAMRKYNGSTGFNLYPSLNVEDKIKLDGDAQFIMKIMNKK